MTNKPRKISEKGAYHVILMGHNRDTIFHDDEDRATFLRDLHTATEKYHCKITTYVLMSNHIHLLIEGKLDDFVLTMKSMGGRFCKWYNRKYCRSGSLFDQRYHSVPIKTEPQYIETAAYILNNPVKAGILEDPEDYEWSNFKDIISKNSEYTDLELLDRVINLEEFVRFVKEKAQHLSDELEGVLPRRISDDECRKIACIQLNSKKWKKAKRKLQHAGDRLLQKQICALLDKGSTLAQINRVFAISRYKLYKLFQ